MSHKAFLFDYKPPCGKLSRMDRLAKLLEQVPTEALVAVSGGIDSVAMLHALVEAGKKPIVVHYHHGWRSASDQDLLFVKTLAARYRLRFISGKARSSLIKKKQEAVARDQRYRFFSRVILKTGIFHLLLAHQADDQVETYLLQLLRGSGSGGQGMLSVVSREGMILHRPWLGVWRKEIADYAWEKNLSWREDESNQDSRYRRNFIRHRLMPYLKKNFSSQVSQNLWRSAEIQQAEQSFWQELCRCDVAGPELSVDRLRELPLAQQRRTLWYWLREQKVSDLSFQKIEAVRHLITQVRPARINLAQGRFARRRSGKIFLD